METPALWMLFIYYLGNLLTRLLVILTFVNLLVCGNVLLLCLTFWMLRKMGKKKPIAMGSVQTMAEKDRKKEEKEHVRLETGKPIETVTTSFNVETGKREKWVQKNIWIKED